MTLRDLVRKSGNAALEQELSRLLATASREARMAPIVERCIRDQETEQICWFCDFLKGEKPHVDCVLVANGFITPAGERIENG